VRPSSESSESIERQPKMARPVELVIRAKSMVARGLTRVSKAVKDFAARSAQMMKRFAVGTIAAGAAVTALATKFVSAYAQQEAAERSLIAARRASGDSLADNIDKQKQMAAAIQDETGIADELTLQRMARLRLLGVETDALGDAAKAAIALVHAGMGEETALRAVAAARGGDFAMLTRYIPALRTANTEAEKAQIVNDLLNNSYNASKEELNTVQGQWKNLTGRIGDFQEVIGAAINNSAGVQELLAKMAAGVKRAGDRVAEWVNNGGIDVLLKQARTFATEAVTGFRNFGDITGAVFSALLTAGKAGFENLGIAAFNASKIAQNAWENTTNKIGFWLARTWEEAQGREFVIEPPKIKELTDGLVDMKDAIGEGQKLIDAALKRTENRNARAAEKVSDIWAQNAQKVAKSAEKAADKQIQLADNVQRRQKQIQNKAAKDEIALLRNQANEAERVAKAGVAAFMAQQKKAAEDIATQEKESARAKMLIARRGRGIKLSKKDKAFMDARLALADKRQEAQDKRAMADALEAMWRGEQRQLMQRQAGAVEGIEKKIDKAILMG